MNIETIREYILQKPSVTEGFPFGEDTLVFKVNEKIFLLKEKDSLNYKSYYKCLINNTGSTEAEVFINGLPPVL